ncbi:geranylgeranyl reductase family protein [Geodermatophilus sabuli]|uniref:Geranylgeranyl reductase family n=1 Tax=Geodermatophilus sabuli TaxID=1564158 RepID=A0A285EJ11_9ACTN|nr:geranylgeranyl reductase family protein [Geodermatophilus sabuli]MBB3083178.1 geranylgeranyl reductase family protein [Geodermatophilus sabuli]SNX98174.1 geranylgeranyl reductase family [Geodermatophilus sabuli]
MIADAAAPTTTDVLVVGAGPAGAAAAAWAARAGHDVVLADAAVFPRDKTCGDGLTPRAMAELDHLGLGDWARGHARNRGLRAAGFGREWQLPWPGGEFPAHGSAVPRTELDARIRDVALTDGATPLDGARAVDVERNGDRVTGVVFEVGDETVTVGCRRLVVADGARSPLGRVLGREWHRGTAYGVAARGYVRSGRADDEWISSHLELRGAEGELLSGYGWVFPLGAASGQVNIGVGTLATARRPAGVQLKALLETYADARRADWRLDGPVEAPASALLPMGGAVSNVAGGNWALVGDAAGCVNPLNGEGIDYGLETGRSVVQLFDEDDWSAAWPAALRRHYGEAFSIARRLAGLLTVPRFLPAAGPVSMRSRALMTVALRVMGNLVTDADRDLVARLWRTAGRLSVRVDERPPFS